MRATCSVSARQPPRNVMRNFFNAPVPPMSGTDILPGTASALETVGPGQLGELLARVSPKQDTSWQESTARHQVSPRLSVMMKSCCWNCHWCDSAQMVQQQLKLVATLSGQLWEHLAGDKTSNARASSNSANTAVKRRNPTLQRDSPNIFLKKKHFLIF